MSGSHDDATREAQLSRLLLDVVGEAVPESELIARYARELESLSEDERGAVERYLEQAPHHADGIRVVRALGRGWPGDRPGPAIPPGAPLRARRAPPRWVGLLAATVATAAAGVLLVPRLPSDEARPELRLAMSPSVSASPERSSVAAPRVVSEPALELPVPSVAAADLEPTDSISTPPGASTAPEASVAPVAASDGLERSASAPSPRGPDVSERAPGLRPGPLATPVAAAVPEAGSEASRGPSNGGAPSPAPARDPAARALQLASLVPPVYRRPAESASRTRISGTVRSVEAPIELTALAPTHVARTQVASPALLFHLDRAPPSGSLRVELTARDSFEPLAVAELPLPERAGIQRIDLAALELELPLGREVIWAVVLAQDPDDPSRDRVALGWIERIEPDPTLEQAALSERAARYAEAGLWYDALGLLDALRSSDPDAAAVARAFDSLLDPIRSGTDGPP